MCRLGGEGEKRAPFFSEIVQPTNRSDMGRKKHGARRSAAEALPPPSSPAVKNAAASKEKGKVKSDPPFLSMDIWSEILLRVPAEDLVKLKRVCRAWRDVISRPEFAESHVDVWTSRPDTGLVLDMDYGVDQLGSWMHDVFYLSCQRRRLRYRRFRLNDHFLSCRCHGLPMIHRGLPMIHRGRVEKFRTKKLRVLASCDGLALVCYSGQTHYQLLLCNPFTASYRSLPAFRPEDTRCFSLEKISDSFEWTVVRSGSVGEYKIFGLDKSHGSLMRCYVLEVQRGGGGGCEGRPESVWKVLPAPPLLPRWTVRASMAKGGKVHWLAITGGRKHRNHMMKVLSMDIVEEEFTESDSFSEPGFYFASRGTFYCIRGDCDELSLATLEDFGSMKWTVRHNSWSLGPDFQPASIERAAILGDSKLVMSFHGRTYALDMITRKFESVGGPELKHILDENPWGLVPHTNSLVQHI